MTENLFFKKKKKELLEPAVDPSAAIGRNASREVTWRRAVMEVKKISLSVKNSELKAQVFLYRKKKLNHSHFTVFKMIFMNMNRTQT